MSQSSSNQNARGFTLIEGLIAGFVLTAGLLTAGALISDTLRTTDRSRYMTAALVLASEKLEDLSRWPATDPHVIVTSGTAGSLVADTTADIPVDSGTVPVNYFDEVAISLDSGSFAVTVSSQDEDGNTVYTTTTHSPDGVVATTTSDDPPGQVNFRRRWLIEQDQPVAGVRRVTVRVELVGAAITPPIQFDMTMVRP